MERLVTLHDQLVHFLRTDWSKQLALIVSNLTMNIVERDRPLHLPEAPPTIESTPKDNL